ncbi:MAG: cytochrome c-type biogenesis protein CcmH [Alphaproteobacteria bacterium]|nr:cytochrome c-type biogenesis protein CcmH [Alphaproteobacteria bacterium]
MRPTLIAAALLAALPFAQAWAVEPHEILKDPTLEARAREVGKQLRCVVCQNQAIDDSNAELAGDMRVLVRERIQAGDSNQQVIDYMVDRYGDYVLLDPPFKARTLVLWIGPGVIALLGLGWLASYFRRREGVGGQTVVAAGEQVQPLSDEERRRLDQLMKDENA